MDTFWLCFLVVLFNFFIWITSVYAQGRCHHPCTGTGNCSFTFAENRCYYVFKDKLRSWEDSKKQCEKHGLQMIKINNEGLAAAIASGLLSDLPSWINGRWNPQAAWLGGKALYYESWSFLDGNQVKDEQLDTGLSVSTDWEGRANCGCFSPRTMISWPLNTYSIKVQGCHIKGNYICRRSSCETPDSQNCLVFSKEQKTWFEARSHCRDTDGDLFYLKEDEKLSKFGLDAGSMFDSIRYASFNVYIGIVHRQWIWHDGVTIYDTNWATREPNYYNQGCLSMYGNNGKWDDRDCGDKLLTLCQGEIKTTPVTQSTTEQITTTTNRNGLTPPAAAEPDRSTATPTSSTISTAANDTGNGKASDFIGQDVNTNTMIIIIIAVLLGVFFLLSIALISYLICKKQREKVAETEDAEIIDNNYYEGTVERTVNDDAPRQVTTNDVNGNAGDRTIVPEKPKALPNYEDVHLYGNDVTDSLPKNKPVLKPKPKVGPVNGDVYSQVTMVRSTSPISPDSDTTYMNAN